MEFHDSPGTLPPDGDGGAVAAGDSAGPDDDYDEIRRAEAEAEGVNGSPVESPVAGTRGVSDVYVDESDAAAPAAAAPTLQPDDAARLRVERAAIAATHHPEAAAKAVERGVTSQPSSEPYDGMNRIELARWVAAHVPVVRGRRRAVQCLLAMLQEPPQYLNLPPPATFYQELATLLNAEGGSTWDDDNKLRRRSDAAPAKPVSPTTSPRTSPTPAAPKLASGPPRVAEVPGVVGREKARVSLLERQGKIHARPTRSPPRDVSPTRRPLTPGGTVRTRRQVIYQSIAHALSVEGAPPASVKQAVMHACFGYTWNADVDSW